MLLQLRNEQIAVLVEDVFLILQCLCSEAVREQPARVAVFLGRTLCNYTRLWLSKLIE